MLRALEETARLASELPTHAVEGVRGRIEELNPMLMNEMMNTAAHTKYLVYTSGAGTGSPVRPR